MLSVFLLFSSLFVLFCFSLPLSIRFCLVFFVYTFLPYINTAFYHFYPPSFSALFFYTFLFCFSLPLSIRFSLVFFVYILVPYIATFSIIFIFISSPLFTYFLQTSFFPFFPLLSFLLSSLPLPLVYFSTFSNFFIVHNFHPFLIH